MLRSRTGHFPIHHNDTGRQGVEYRLDKRSRLLHVLFSLDSRGDIHEGFQNQLSAFQLDDHGILDHRNPVPLQGSDLDLGFMLQGLFPEKRAGQTFGQTEHLVTLPPENLLLGLRIQQPQRSLVGHGNLPVPVHGHDSHGQGFKNPADGFLGLHRIFRGLLPFKDDCVDSSKYQ